MNDTEKLGVLGVAAKFLRHIPAESNMLIIRLNKCVPAWDLLFPERSSLLDQHGLVDCGGKAEEHVPVDVGFGVLEECRAEQLIAALRVVPSAECSTETCLPTAKRVSRFLGLDVRFPSHRIVAACRASVPVCGERDVVRHV